LAFDLQPTLRGESLTLHPLRAGDYELLYAVASDPLIWELHPANDRWKAGVFREFFRTAMESGGAFIVIDNQDGRAIGSTRYHGYDEVKSEIEIGWTFLARSHWGGAHNREMKGMMLRHAFQFVNSVIFRVGAYNYRSRRAMEKIGGVLIGSGLDAAGREGVVYQITPATFFGSAKREG